MSPPVHRGGKCVHASVPWRRDWAAEQPAGQAEQWRPGSHPSCGAPRERMGGVGMGEKRMPLHSPWGCAFKGAAAGQGGKVLKLMHEEGQAGAESRKTFRQGNAGTCSGMWQGVRDAQPEPLGMALPPLSHMAQAYSKSSNKVLLFSIVSIRLMRCCRNSALFMSIRLKWK